MIFQGVVGLDAQQFQVTFLEEEGHCLCEGGVGDTVEHEVVDVVHGDSLFDTMAEFVDGDVIPFVVHTGGAHAGAQVGQIIFHAGAPGMTGAPGGINGDEGADPLGIGRRPPQFLHDHGKVFLHRLGVGVLFRGEGCQLLFGNSSRRFEPVVPDVKGLQGAPQPLADQRSYFLHQGGGDEFGEQPFHIFLRNFHSLLKSSADISGEVGIVGVDALHGVEIGQEYLISLVGFRGSGDFTSAVEDLVVVRIPGDAVLVDDLLRNRLVDDALHHLVNHPLFGEAVFGGIVRFEFVAEAPVGDQLQSGGK